MIYVTPNLSFWNKLFKSILWKVFDNIYSQTIPWFSPIRYHNRSVHWPLGYQLTTGHIPHKPLHYVMNIIKEYLKVVFYLHCLHILRVLFFYFYLFIFFLVCLLSFYFEDNTTSERGERKKTDVPSVYYDFMFTIQGHAFTTWAFFMICW